MPHARAYYGGRETIKNGFFSRRTVGMEKKGKNVRNSFKRNIRVPNTTARGYNRMRLLFLRRNMRKHFYI